MKGILRFHDIRCGLFPLAVAVVGEMREEGCDWVLVKIDLKKNFISDKIHDIVKYERTVMMMSFISQTITYHTARQFVTCLHP